MVGEGRIAAEILVSSEFREGEERAVASAFAQLGVEPRVRVVPVRRGPGDLQWLVLAALPLHAFLSGIGTTLAGEATRGLKGLVGKAVGGRRGAAGEAPVLVLQDPVTRLQIALEADLPDEAYAALVSTDLSSLGKGTIRYDRHRGVWRSEGS
ncbi:hypothetical protein [Actinomadura rudentiformis]|uniref:Uncharacterized protein n=1 Tax=Actinomadura rudentiformis TaxID=359158 RepID=A0A6H9YIW9_9ACTN|nr:hypothetical protein [Actinomadura rudentiformis]KAB2339760.1 hypothetical protein F8566_46645 [Actinomadura rudentiformis]